jgi:hypothetical protein
VADRNQGQLQKTFGCHDSIGEAIDRDAIAGAAGFLTLGIGQRGERCVQFAAIGAPSEPDEVGLPGMHSEADVREIAQLVGRQVQDGD